jgi:hypothetical protein
MNEQEEPLMAEIETRVKELKSAIAHGEPPARWKARRAEIDDLQLRLQAVRTGRYTRQSVKGH